MSRKSHYFLIARDKITNQAVILDVNGSYGSSLEEIDLYTTCFQDELTLSSVLHKEGRISDHPMDLFIAHQTKTNGKRKLSFQEVLYSNGQDVRSIAKASANGHIELEQKQAMSIFHLFCYKMKHNQKFYNMVLYGHTNLYTKFVRYFSDRRFLDSYHLKFKDGGWILKSYPLIREMVESFSLFERDPKGIVAQEKFACRKSLEDALLLITDREYNPNQASLFEEEEQDSLERVLIEQKLLPKEEVGAEDGKRKRKKRDE